MKKLRIGFTAACIAVSSATASSQQAPQSEAAASIEERFRILDADGDGFVSMEEASQARAEEFRRLDRNRDGRVSEREFTDRALPLSEFDADRSGDLSMQEYVEGHLGMFKKFDHDGNFRISLEEFRQAQEALRR